MKLLRSVILSVVVSLLAIVIASCSGSDGQSHSWPQRLVVGTLYSPTSFFILRGDTLGYDYDRICELAHDKGVEVQFRVAPNINALVAMLSAGEIDIIAAQVPNSSDYRRKVINCGSVNETRPVLVQMGGDSAVSDLTQLAGRDVYVEKGTNAESLMSQLNSQLGGMVVVHTVPDDSVSTDDMLDMVACGKIPFTVVDSDIAQFCGADYKDLDFSVNLGASQMSSWAVDLSNKWLADSIDAWSNSTNARAYSKATLERYVKRSRAGEDDLSDQLPHIGSRPYNHSGYSPHYTGPATPSRPLSPSSFDQLFHHYGGASGWDWRLLSAIARVESNYNPQAKSWAGARGLMQIMPGTARGYGVNPDMLFEPEVSVRVASRCLRDLDNTFRSRVPDRNERLKFVVAAYNSGAGHVLDAMALASKHGRDPKQWYGNVEDAMLWKSNPQYYNDPVCRFGYCRGRETTAYVRSVLSRYH